MTHSCDEIVFSFIHRFMASREPFKLTKFLIIYNFLQVTICIYFVLNCLRNELHMNTIWKCNSIGFTNIQHIKLIYLAFLVKNLELVETVCFMLRKKSKQISFLHVYHHISTLIFTYFAFTRIGGEPLIDQ